MPIDVQKYKVIYKERVLKALSIQDFFFRDGEIPGTDSNVVIKPKAMTVTCVDENGNIVFICDEAWRFQFIPNLAMEG